MKKAFRIKNAVVETDNFSLDEMSTIDRFIGLVDSVLKTEEPSYYEESGGLPVEIIDI